MNNLDITKILGDFSELVRTLGVAERCYDDRRKASEKADAFVVLKVPGGVKDKGTFGECTLSVRLFARDVANAVNGKKLSVMQTRLFSGLPLGYRNYIYDDCPTILGDTSDDLGFHARIINIRTTIKTEE